MAENKDSPEWVRLARLPGQHVDTSLRNLREWMGRGLKYSKVGGAVFINLADLHEWMRKHEVSPVSDEATALLKDRE